MVQAHRLMLTAAVVSYTASRMLSLFFKYGKIFTEAK